MDVLAVFFLCIGLGVAAGVFAYRFNKRNGRYKHLSAIPGVIFGLLTIVLSMILLMPDPPPEKETKPALSGPPTPLMKAEPAPGTKLKSEPVSFDVLSAVERELKLLPMEVGNDVLAAGSFEIAESNSEYLRLYLVWNRKPKSMFEVETYTNLAAEALAKAATNHFPQDIPYLSVYSRKSEKGVTGKDVVRVFGHSFFESSSDQVKFVAAK